jgi:hypothetical protein
MRRRTLIIGLAIAIGGGASFSLFGDGFGWEKDTIIKGIPFEKAKVESNGLIVGKLRASTVIAGRPCRKGWVHVHSNGVPAGFTASEDITLARFTVAAGTWVVQDLSGVVRVCAFAKDTEVKATVVVALEDPRACMSPSIPTAPLSNSSSRVRRESTACRATQGWFVAGSNYTTMVD